MKSFFPILWNTSACVTASAAAAAAIQSTTLSSNHSKTPPSSTPRTRVFNTFHGHSGIVWKVRWSEGRDKVVSVSDDRTVRVWDVARGVELFCGYGHECRVWDAIFLGAKDEAVVTCGEDTFLKVWDVSSKKCVSTMQGHASKTHMPIYLQ